MKCNLRFLSLLLSVVLILWIFAISYVGISAETASGSAAGFAVRGLQVNSLTLPVGIDEAPRFSWQMTSLIIGQRQTAYQIMVSSTAEKLAAGDYDMWDSEKVSSDNSILIPYGGGALAASTRYFWQVRVWGMDGAAALSKEEAYWETGLTDGWGDTRWIGATPPASSGSSGGSGDPGIPKEQHTTFTIDLDFTIISGALGFVFGAQDTSNFYMWQIHAEQNRLRPHRWNGGSISELSGADLSAAYPGKDALGILSHMTIQVNEGKIVTTINGAVVDTRTVAAFDLGRIGFRQNPGEGAKYEKAWTDNIVIKDKDGAILFAENFDSGRNTRFDGGAIEEGGIVAERGLFLQSLPPSGFAHSIFTIDLDYMVTGTEFGVVFGAKDQYNFYMWQIRYNTSLGYATIRPHQWIENNTRTFSDPTDISVIYPTEASLTKKRCHLTLEVENGLVITKIDGVVYDTRKEPAFDLGIIGLRGAALVENIVVKDQNGVVLLQSQFDQGLNMFNDGTVMAGGKLQTSGLIFQADSWFLYASAPMLRREFTLTRPVKSARLYATSQGIYELFVNGQKAGDSYLNPGSSQYNKTKYYQTYDVTSLLRAGENAVGGILGHGWYNGAKREFGSKLALYAKLLVTYDDGSTFTLSTDKHWSYYGKGPVTYDDIYNGESYDATLEVEGWSEPGLDDALWTESQVFDVQNTMAIAPGNIIAQNMPPIRNKVTFTPIAVTEPQPGVYIYDFGQNFAGIARVKATAPRGTVMTLRHAEFLNGTNMQGVDGPPGTLYVKNLYTAKNTDRYTFKGDSAGEVFEPTLTYHGFRYLEITGLDQPLPVEAVEGLALYSDLPETGEFTSSNDLVNQLFNNAFWSQRSNFTSLPTDCPQRAERMGWTGDAQIFARTASYNMDTNRFFQKFCVDMRDCQTVDGKFPEETPGWWRAGASDKATSGWGDAGVIIPWQMYQQYGDVAAITENYSAMVKWVDYLVDFSPDFIRDVGWTGDWLPADGNKTPFGVTDTAYCAYSAKLLSKMAAVIGKTQDAEKYAQISEKFREAWNEAYVNADGSTTCDTQTSYAIGLQFDLFEEDVRELAAAKLAENILKNNTHLTTGFLGVSYLNPSLSDAGYSELAYALLEQTDCPSWLYSVIAGATTIWERWNLYEINPDGSSKIVHDSQNHYSYGAICEWLYTDVLGIDRDEDNPGFKRFVLHPTPGGSFTYAKGSYDSIYGKIVSEWTAGENGMNTYRTVVPANTAATLYLPVSSANGFRDIPGVTYMGMTVYNGQPAAEFQLLSGGYDFTVSEDGVTAAAADGYITGETAFKLNGGENVRKTYGDSKFTLGTTGANGAITYESKNEAIATIAANGEVTIIGAGETQITAYDAGGNNHESATDAITLTVDKKAVTVTADNKTKYFGEADPDLTYSVDSPLVGGDTLTGSLKYTGATVGAYDIVEATAFSNPNYEITFVKGTMTIKRTLTMVEVIKAINALPSPVETWDDADKVADVTNDYENLTDEEKDQIPDDVKKKLEDAQEQAGEINRKDDDIAISAPDLPWYVRVVATPVPETDSRYSGFLDNLSDKKLLTLYDIKLINTLTGEEYELPAGETVTVEISGTDLNGAKEIVIAHQKADGTIEYITATVKDNKVTFTVSSFSLYGVTANADAQPKPTDPSPQTGDNSNPAFWLLLGGAALTVLGGTLVAGKKRRRFRIARHSK